MSPKPAAAEPDRGLRRLCLICATVHEAPRHDACDTPPCLLGVFVLRQAAQDQERWLAWRPTGSATTCIRVR
jgi:hypothetical protein